MKKRILFIVNSLAGGGVEKVLITILKNFDYTCFDVELLLVYNEGIFLNEVPREVRVRYLYSKSLSFREKLNYNLLAHFGCDWGYKLMMKEKSFKQYDVIISFVQGLSLKYHSYIVTKASNNISWVHSDLYNWHSSIGHFFSEKQEKIAYSKMDKIIFVSHNVKKQFEKLYSENQTLKEVILNPIEKELISQYKREYEIYSGDRCFNIVSIGRLSSEKCFDRLVRLAERLKSDNYNFHINIIGEGELRGDLENLIIKNKVEDKVTLVGFVKSPYDVMSKADLFVLPSLTEGYPLVLCEALCLGLPVVATNVAGSSELIDNNKYGLLTEHDDESIYQAVKKMIDDDSLREYYHGKSLERAEIFDVKSVMNQIYSILD